LATKPPGFVHGYPATLKNYAEVNAEASKNIKNSIFCFFLIYFYYGSITFWQKENPGFRARVFLRLLKV